jgi:DNA-binding protein HU-beta
MLLAPSDSLDGDDEMPAKRTTHRSSTGKKLYSERDAKGQFKDVQTYERAHGQDVKRRSKAEAKKKR